MKDPQTTRKNEERLLRFPIRSLYLCLFTTIVSFKIYAQTCPDNIDFEKGTFDGWTCYTGTTYATGVDNIIAISPSGGPVANRHTMYSAFQNPGNDPYGHFPIMCPNGSRNTVRLGNDQAGTEAEGISYVFTIPANRNEYSLIYHYATVFEDPSHLPDEQPRFVVEITNITDNTIIYCSSFTFFAVGSLLPGFFLSPNPPGNAPVWCKDWSAVSINLDGLAGKTIHLFFKTADCTFRRHFGYAYIDVNTECSGEFVGAAYCPGDTSINVVAPYGYQVYNWYDETFTQLLGTNQNLTLSPPPPPNTNIAVEVVPYHGYGCVDTLYAKLIDTLTVKANAGIDTMSCNKATVSIGAPPRPGIVYSWTPTTGLSNPTMANPLVNPAVTTTYILTAKSGGGGCIDTDTVVVVADNIDNSMEVMGSLLYCIDSEDSTVLRVLPADSIQWYRNNAPIVGANGREYLVNRSGSYHAVLFNNSGCNLATTEQEVTIEIPKPGITYPIQYAVIDYPVTLQARKIGVTALWDPSINLDDRTSFTPVFKSSLEQVYTIEITTLAGCVTVDTQFVKTVKSVEILVPTAFTPNNDGKNDYLRPILVGVKDLHYFKVFNRWGQLIYQTNTDNPGWDGKIKGTLQASQVVVWIAEALGLDGRIHQRKGTTVLIR